MKDWTPSAPLAPGPATVELVRLTLPVPPSANRYWRTVNGRPIVSAEARAYRQTVRRLAAVAGYRAPHAGPVRVDLAFYRARKSGDLDNRLKVTLDALKGIAFEDDSQVVEIHARRADDKENPRMDVSVTGLFVIGGEP